MKRMFRSALIGVVAIGLAGCNREAGPQPPAPQAPAEAVAPTNVRMMFDGGFMFVKHADGSMSVVSPRHAEHNEASLKVMTSATTSYPLKDWRISLVGVDASTNTVVPAGTRVEQEEQTCDPIPGQGSHADNLAWLPNLRELHPGATLALSDDAMESQIMLGAGTLKVAMAYGCWALANAKGSQKPQSLVYGDNSVWFTMTTTRPSIGLTFTPLKPGTAKEFTVEIPVTAGNDVVIEVGYPRISEEVQGTITGGEMADFGRHYQLVAGVDRSDRYKPIAKIDHSRGGPGHFPGRECGSAIFIE